MLGPGDLYTSIIPNLLVDGTASAIAASKAKLVYVANLMTKFSETHDFALADFLAELISYGVGRTKFDAVLVNTTPIPAELIADYAQKEHSAPVAFSPRDAKKLRRYAHDIVVGDFLSAAGLTQGLIRHDSKKLAKQLLERY